MIDIFEGEETCPICKRLLNRVFCWLDDHYYSKKYKKIAFYVSNYNLIIFYLIEKQTYIVYLNEEKLFETTDINSIEDLITLRDKILNNLIFK